MRAVKVLEAIQNFEDREQEIEADRDTLLRSLGWKHSSSHPGGLWLWEKNVNGRDYTLNTDCAIHIEESLAVLRGETLDGEDDIG